MDNFLLYYGSIFPLDEQATPLYIWLVIPILTDAPFILYIIACHCLVFFHFLPCFRPPHKN